MPGNPISRRTALQWMFAAAASAKLSPSFSTLASVFDAPVSRVFGIAGDGSARDPETLYRVGTPAESELSFDVSNNQILASFNRYGALRQACAATAVSMLPPEEMKGGVYSTKELKRGGPWTLAIGPPDPTRETAVDLVGGVFPMFTTHSAGLRIRTLVFAPCDAGDAQPPRALIALISITDVEGTRFSTETYTLGQDESRLRSRSPLDWFNATWKVRTSAYGELAIPEAPYFAESIVRFAENCRQSALLLPDGRVAGGFLGSDVDSRPVNWVRDLYHSMLAMSMFDPDLCAESILYFLQWNLPLQPVGRGLARFPEAGRVTQSLGNALSPLLLSGAYYQMTGDRAFFLAHPEILRVGSKLLDQVLASRRGEPFLFPSMFISDGDARGDYHTGSNIAAWKAFDVMVRLAREVYNEAKLSEKWSQTAARIRRDIWAHCSGPGPLGRQFYEGAMADSTFVPGHDGEESDTTLTPFYGFCESDEPALLHFAQLALSETNPFYSRELDAVWWYNEKWSSATFPAWITALAGAGNEQEVAARLQRIRQLTDLDGSIWWWPYRYETKDRTSVLRANSARKCGWASGVYLCTFVHNILGIGFDSSTRTLAFRPFLPWNRFSWRNCRLGRGMFHFHYDRTPGLVTASLVNLTASPLTVTIELMGPPNSKAVVCLVNGNRAMDAKPGERSMPQQPPWQ